MSITAGNFKDGTTGWKVRELEAKENIPAGFEIHFSDDGECVTDFVYKREDANLIAAAPELLEALEVAADKLKYSKDITQIEFEYLKSVINKAKRLV